MIPMFQTSLLRRLFLIFLLPLPLLGGQPAGLVEPLESMRGLSHLRTASTGHRGDRETVELIVQFKTPRWVVAKTDASDPAARAAALNRDLEQLQAAVPLLVGTQFRQLIYGASVTVRHEEISRVRALPNVASVHLARRFRLLESSGDGEPGRARAVRMAAAGGGSGRGVTVAVIDTGIDYRHAALGGGLGAGFKVIGGWDFVNDGPDPLDDHGHGTHVAGIIAGEGSGVRGVAPGVSLLAYKVLDARGFGSESDIIAAIERAVDPNGDGDPSDRVDVVNMSLGAPATVDDPVAVAVARAIELGVVFSIAVGNSGAWAAISSPAIVPSAISVGAANANGKAAAFSTRGPSLDYGIKPEVTAPGVGVVSTIRGGGTAAFSGTSMSAPYVAGIAALLKERHPDRSPAELKAAIVSSVMPGSEHVMVVGAGQADAARALAMEILPSPSTLSFGRVDAAAGLVTLRRTVVLRNDGAAVQSLSAAVDGLSTAITLTLTPEKVSVMPGESVEILAELTIDLDRLEEPPAHFFSFGGRLQWNGGSVPLTVPWGFVRASFLTIEETSDAIAFADVLFEGGTVGTDLFMGSAYVLAPLGVVDVVVSRWLPSPQAVVIRESVDTRQASLLSVDLRQADKFIVLATIDETNAMLDSEGRECHELFVLSFPSGQKLVVSGSLRNRTGFSPVSERIRFYPLHQCADSRRDRIYAAMHEPFNGLSESPRLSWETPSWIHQEVSFTPELPPYQALMSIVFQLRFPGDSDEEYFSSGGTAHLMRGVSSKLGIYFNASPAPEIDLMAALEWMGRCDPDNPDNVADCTMLDSATLYLVPDAVAVDTDHFLTVSPMAYRPHAGEPLLFGNVPLLPQVHFGKGATSWAAAAHWHGPLGERNIGASRQNRITLRDAAGSIVGDGAWVISGAALVPGPYQIEAVARTVVNGFAGSANFTGWFDTSAQDFLLPLMTGMRIIDGEGRQTSRIAPGGAATLQFSVVDVKAGELLARERVAPAEEATRVEYRRHGSTSWSPLPPLLHERHYPFSTYFHGGVGTMYRVDLGAVTSQMLGAVDVRISAADEAGNTIELRLEPAFIIDEERPRGRPVRRP
jgi:subtilisin family serine protease